MTVSSTPRRAGPFLGNDVTASFPFTFKVFSAAEVQVTLKNAAGVESVLTSGFTVTLNADQDNEPGGSVGYPLATGETLTITGDLPVEQQLDLTNLSRRKTQAIENGLDYLTILVQQQDEQAARTLVFPVSDEDPGAQLPTASQRANKALIFDALGNVGVSEDNYVDQVATVTAAAQAAAASQLAAAGSASQAEAGRLDAQAAAGEVAASASVAASGAATAQAAVAALSQAGLGFSRYIDANTGNDANNGLTPATPWRSFAPVAALGAGASGLAIGVARGSVFNTEVALTAANVRIGAYGNGALARPRFDPRVTITGAWTNVGGNTWSISVACVADVKHKGNIFRNGQIMRQFASQAAMEAAAVGGCFVTDWTTNPRQIFITSVTNPNTDANLYSHPFWGTGLTITGDYWVIEDLETIGPAHQDGSFRGLGRFGVQRRCKHSMGARHCCYTYPQSLTEDCEIGPAYNPLEGSANTLVVNITSSPGEGYTVRRTLFTGEGLPAGITPNVTGPFQHDGSSTTIMGTQLIEDCSFVRLSSWMTVSGADTRVVRPTFTNVTGGAVIGPPGAKLTVVDDLANATVDQLYNTGVGGSVFSARNSHLVGTLGTGFYRYSGGTTDLALALTGERLTVQGGVSFGNNAQVVRHARGSISMFDCNVTQPNDEPLCAPIDRIVSAGFAAASSYLGDRNVFPYGSCWTLNGVDRNTLAEWQAATGQDLNSTVRQPVVVGSDAFNRADENLEASANWTRVGGAAAQAAVRTNQLACIGTTQTLYRRANAAGVNHWVGCTIAQVPATAGPYVVLRAADENNWIGVRWTGTTYQIGRCIAGVLTASVTSSSAVAPAVGQRVILAVKGDQCWLYVDGRTLLRSAGLAATALAANTGVGVLPRGSVVNPFIDDFEFGVVQ